MSSLAKKNFESEVDTIYQKILVKVQAPEQLLIPSVNNPYSHDADEWFNNLWKSLKRDNNILLQSQESKRLQLEVYLWAINYFKILNRAKDDIQEIPKVLNIKNPDLRLAANKNNEEFLNLIKMINNFFDEHYKELVFPFDFETINYEKDDLDNLDNHIDPKIERKRLSTFGIKIKKKLWFKVFQFTKDIKPIEIDNYLLNIIEKVALLFKYSEEKSLGRKGFLGDPEEPEIFGGFDLNTYLLLAMFGHLVNFTDPKHFLINQQCFLNFNKKFLSQNRTKTIIKKLYLKYLRSAQSDYEEIKIQILDWVQESHHNSANINHSLDRLESCVAAYANFLDKKDPMRQFQKFKGNHSLLESKYPGDYEPNTYNAGGLLNDIFNLNNLVMLPIFQKFIELSIENDTNIKSSITKDMNVHMYISPNHPGDFTFYEQHQSSFYGLLKNEGISAWLMFRQKLEGISAEHDALKVQSQENTIKGWLKKINSTKIDENTNAKLKLLINLAVSEGMEDGLTKNIDYLEAQMKGETQVIHMNKKEIQKWDDKVEKTFKKEILDNINLFMNDRLISENSKIKEKNKKIFKKIPSHLKKYVKHLNYFIFREIKDDRLQKLPSEIYEKYYKIFYSNPPKKSDPEQLRADTIHLALYFQEHGDDHDVEWKKHVKKLTPFFRKRVDFGKLLTLPEYKKALNNEENKSFQLIKDLILIIDQNPELSFNFIQAIGRELESLVSSIMTGKAKANADSRTEEIKADFLRMTIQLIELFYAVLDDQVSNSIVDKTFRLLLFVKGLYPYKSLERFYLQPIEEVDELIDFFSKSMRHMIKEFRKEYRGYSINNILYVWDLINALKSIKKYLYLLKKYDLHCIVNTKEKEQWIPQSEAFILAKIRNKKLNFYDWLEKKGRVPGQNYGGITSNMRKHIRPYNKLKFYKNKVSFKRKNVMQTQDKGEFYKNNLVSKKGKILTENLIIWLANQNMHELRMDYPKTFKDINFKDVWLSNS